MVIRARLDPMTVSRLRWAPSPVFETANWLTITASGRRHPLWGDPGPAARMVLRDRDVAITASLMSAGLTGGYMPDFVTPKPDPDAGNATSLQLGGQLERIRSAARESVELQLAYLSGFGHRVPQIDSVDLRGVVAGGLLKFWRQAMAERWVAMRTLLLEQQERQIRAAATTGVGPVLNSLHSSLRWHAGSLEVDKPYAEELDYRDAEIVLVPSLVAWPRLVVQLCDPADAMVVYPVAGSIGRMKPPAEALLGRSRSRVLQRVGSATSTTDLSRELRLAPATVSHHLAVLLEAGLVCRTRRGRWVLYCRTDTGQRLLDAAG